MSLISWSSYLESNSCSASLEIVSIQWNPKVEPFSQEPAQGSYPDESSPHNPIPFKTHFNFFSHLDLGLRGGFFISGFPYKILWVFIFAYTHTNSSTYSSPWCYHSNKVWRRVEIEKILVMQFFPDSWHFLPLRFKYYPQHPLLKHR